MTEDTPTLSVCIIAKNEEDMIGAAIGSVTGVAAEVIVVDTGSSDRTKEIATSRGAEVIEHPWQRDFAEAKNYAIEQASSEWVLILDADEELYEADHDELRNALRSADTGNDEARPNLLLLEFVDLAMNENYYLPRILRRSSAIRYRGKVHEMLSPADPKAITIKVRILHKGYTSDVVKKKEKVSRNQELMEEIEAQNPDDPVNNFHLGALYQSLGNNQKAIHYYEKVVESGAGRDNPKVFKCLLRTYEASKDLKSAMRVARYGLELFPHYTDLWFHLGIDSYLTGNLESARKCFQKCLFSPVGSNAPTHVPGSNSVLARLFLALTEHGLKPSPTNTAQIDDVMQELAKDADALFYLGKIFISAYGTLQAEKQFKDIANLREPAVKRSYDLLFSGGQKLTSK